MIRPQPARWFEILVARDDVPGLLEALAATGATELEARDAAGLPATLTSLTPLLHEFAELALRYHGYLPPSRFRARACHEPPAQTLARCLATLRAWAVDAEPTIAVLQANDVERVELLMWKRLTDACAASAMDLSLAADTQPPLFARVVVCPEKDAPVMPPGVLARRFVIEGMLHALVVGRGTELETIILQGAGHKGTVYPLPQWMHQSMPEIVRHISARLADIDHAAADAASKLEALHRSHDLARALGDAERLDWVIANVRALESDDLFCFVTGWTSDLTGIRLEHAVEQSGSRAVLHYPRPTDQTRAPLVLANPAWSRPFEIFSRALGTPSRAQADPTTLLAIVVPLMFGYMFGDVGQGIVIAVAGFALRRRWPIARLFISGGVAAVGFGLLFGSVFGKQGLIAPLWIDPLHDALTVLLVPLAGGAILLSVGLILNAVQAYWRGEIEHWIAGDAWLMIVYLSLTASTVAPEALYVAAGASGVFCVARAIDARRATAIFAAVAELVERTLQILINTLSFARVGAFALAHAGLSSALVALAGATDTAVGKVIVLVIGNAVVIMLEGMVVSIQTTRLVLFEFFTRFLAAPGRMFQPLPPPPLLTQESS